MCSASELQMPEQSVSVFEGCVHVFKEVSLYSHPENIMIIRCVFKQFLITFLIFLNRRSD
jgi:hypothetical protein